MWWFVINFSVFTTTGSSNPLGRLHVNSVDEISPLDSAAMNGLPIPAFMMHNSSMATTGGITAAATPESTDSGNTVTGFNLDDMCEAGIVALVYVGSLQPQVWFQDLGCEWSFIAASFTDYYRLLVSHLGIPRWQVNKL